MTRPRQGRGTSPASIAAWALFGASVLLMLVGRWLDLQARTVSVASFVEEVLTGLAFLGFPAMGALIASRRPRNPIGWILVGIGVGAALLVLSMGITREALVEAHKPSPLITLAAWFEGWLWYPIAIVIPTFLLLLFPTGRPPSPRWRWLLWLIGALAVAISVAAMMQGTLVGRGYRIDNPIGIAAIRDVEEQFDAIFMLLLPLIAISLSSLVVRYLRGSGEEKQQLKWVALAAGVLVTMSAVADGLEGRVRMPEILFPITLMGLPLSIAIAVLKYRLYDLERVINRALVYAIVTAVLAGTYFGLVVAFQGLLGPLTKESDLAVAASTLGVAALFGPLRRRIQTFIDRRFYRARYDAQRTLETFSSRLRDEVELNHLTNELVTVVSSTMRPRHVSLWLREVTR